MTNTIGNPASWIARGFNRGSRYVGEATGEIGSHDPAAIEVRDLQISDLKDALRKGLDDFMAMRTDVIFIVLIYPVIGALLIVFALNRELIPYLFPMVAGFALLGPVAAIGLYEMSRRREQGQEAGIGDAFSVLGSPSFVPILVLGGYLAAIFVVWMVLAHAVFAMTMGPELPTSLFGFLGETLTTAAGWTMLIVGVAIGFVLAAIVLAMSVVSFPLLIDRHVGLPNAVATSIRVAQRNPVVVAVWGAIVAGLLALGMATFFVGLIVVLPVLGHASWHLYRKAVVKPV